MSRSPPLYDASTDQYTAVYFTPQTLSDRTLGPCRGRRRVHAMHERFVAALLAVCVGLAFVGLARAQGTTGANSGIPLWLPPAAYAPPQGPVHHRQRTHAHGRYRNHTIERHQKKYD